MKSWAEVQTRLMNELKHWFPKQCRCTWERYYLYYCESTAEHDSGLIICKGTPVSDVIDYKLVMPEPINIGLSVEQNYNNIMLSGLLQTLPIL